MMEAKREDSISCWGYAYGVEKRLRETFSSRRGKKLLRWFNQEKLQPDPLMFALIFLVWPVQALRTAQLPAAKVWRDGFQLCRQTAEWLRKHGETCQLPDVDKTSTDLERHAKILRSEQVTVSTGAFSTAFSLPFVRSRGRRDVAKQQTIAFLTGYFKSLTEDRKSSYAEHPPWMVITDFLAMAGLISPQTTPKQVASVWSTSVKRAKKPSNWNENKFGPYEFPQYQAGLLMIFQTQKDMVAGKDTANDYSSRYAQTLADLRRLSTNEIKIPAAIKPNKAGISRDFRMPSVRIKKK